MAIAKQLSTREKIRQAESALKKAKKEIRRLRGHITKGTLHRNRLKSGLTNVTKSLADVPTHK
jgi:hypothetical protein